MASQSNSTFRAIFDTLTLPYQKPNMMAKALCQSSGVLDKLFKIDENKGATGLSTFEGRYVKTPINAYYPVKYSELNDFNITQGDTKQPKNGKNVIYAEIGAVDKGFTMGITTQDLQLLKNKSVDGKIDWVKSFWKDSMWAFGLNILNGAINGDGDTSVNSAGEIKPDLIGLKTGIGTGTYGGKTTSDFYEWQGQVFDWTTTVFGEATVTTTAAATTVASGSLNTPFYNVLMHSLAKCKQFSKSRNYLILMHPAIYRFCWLPSLEVNIKSSKLISANSKDIVGIDRNYTFTMDGTPVYEEYASIPNADIGGVPTYIMPSDYVYILDMDAIKLEVESSNNFKVSDWEDIPNQYNTMQKSVTATLLFYMNKRFSSGKIKLNATMAAAAVSQFGI